MLIPKLAFGTILALLCILAFILAWKATHDEGSRFDFAQAFIDPDGKTSIGRIGIFVALSCSTWAFVYLVLNDKITEWYYTGYMAAWVAQGVGSKWLENK